jgi:AraC-like DNA-binding protein
MDRLTDFLQRFDLRARVTHNGPVSHAFSMQRAEGCGRLHVIRSGRFSFSSPADTDLGIERPAVLFFARPTDGRLIAEADGLGNLISAAVEFSQGDENPMIQGLPSCIPVPLGEVDDVDRLVAVLVAEADGRRCGHAAVLDRLAEAVVVKILRLAIERKLMDRGVVAGLADARLAKALTAVHAAPEQPWSLASMAHTANMSRSRFASRFTETMGMPAAEYLKRWRIGLAKRMLRQGKPIKRIALEVGYGSTASFGRAFGQVEQETPSAWRARQRQLPRYADGDDTAGA